MKVDKDPTFTLFGKKIRLPCDAAVADDLSSPETASLETEKSTSEEEQPEKESVVEKPNGSLQQDHAPSADDKENHPNPKTLLEEESSKSKSPKSEKDQTDASSPQEKTLKKPDKILPCPRCNSMDTKFCYYNNYNVNQPRHFCKACQRYWTAGGTMRNVPVGAGRRKNKNTVSQYRHITISEALQASQMDVTNGISHPALKTNGKVLNFGIDVPICESMSSVLNLGDKRLLNGRLNGFPNFEFNGVQVPGKSGENSDDCSSNSSVTVSGSLGEGQINPQEKLTQKQNSNGFTTQMACLPGAPAPWPLPWNSAVPGPGLCHPGIPMPFYAGAYWNCGVPGPWNVPWLSPQSASSNQSSPTSGSNSPLGKHSRDGNMIKPDGSQEAEQPKQKPAPNGTVLVPKTLRIDDPSEAAKSSIWTALGIKKESINHGRVFGGFLSKNNEKDHLPESSPELKANPAALARSLNFHESV